jgi:hypothetical protein
MGRSPWDGTADLTGYFNQEDYIPLNNNVKYLEEKDSFKQH